MGTVAQFPQQKQPRRKTKITLRAKIFLAFFIGVTIYFIMLKVHGLFMPLFAQVEYIKSYEAEDSIEISGIIIRDEKAISAPNSGTIRFKVANGERVAINSVIAEVISLGGSQLEKKVVTPIKSTLTGIISLQVDGWENTLKEESLLELPPEKISSITHESIKPEFESLSNFEVEGGQTVLKIVNNLVNPRVFLQFPLNSFNKPLKKGDMIYLRNKEDNKLYKSFILDLKGIGNLAHVLAKLDTDGDQLLGKRKMDLLLIKTLRQGLAIPKKALVEENSSYKVMILEKGYATWEQIEVIEIIGDKAFVKGIKELTPVVINSSLFKEGQKLQ